MITTLNELLPIAPPTHPSAQWKRDRSYGDDNSLTGASKIVTALRV